VCVSAGAVALAQPVPETRPIGTTDRQAYDLATQDRFPWLPLQHVEYAEHSAAVGPADGYFFPDRRLIVVTVRSGALSRADYLAVLRHAYGHALLFEWCVAGEGVGSFEGAERFTGDAGASLPEGLLGAAADYRAAPGLFGSYARRSLCEWLAEAYAAYVSGDDVPARTGAFFDALQHGRDAAP
jgi:hypothetical protein